MFGFETLTFATPLALGALALLPVIYWLLRFTPPRPERVRFPPFRLLLDLIAKEDQPDRTPWWLLLLRMAIAAAVILAVSGPFLTSGASIPSGSTPMLVVVDDGWAAAKNWDQRQEVLLRLIEAADRSGSPVALATTTGASEPGEIALVRADDVRERAQALQPRALDTDRAALATRLRQAFGDTPALQVVWLTDGLGEESGRTFAEALKGLAGGRAQVEALLPARDRLGIALVPPRLEGGALKIAAVRVGDDRPVEAAVNLAASNGRSLAEVPLVFTPGAALAEASLELPLELRNEAARLEIASERTAGAVYLFDDRWRRKLVGMLTGANLELAQPLLSPLYYVSRALEPQAELKEGRSLDEIQQLIEQGASMLVLADIGLLGDQNIATLERWVSNGGVLVRFAGPRLAGGHDGMVPVRLREGDRALGSALSWEKPQKLAQFPEGSPFAGLAVDPTVTVSRQVLAEPSPDLVSRVWASLEDGTPLVTATRQGSGMVVLFHVTANADWSNLPLSGLFVEMMNRILDLSASVGGTGEEAAVSNEEAGAFAPVRMLTGFGDLQSPPASARPVLPADFATLRPSPEHPAGIYQRAASQRALNLAVARDRLDAIGTLPAGVAASDYRPAPSFALAGSLFALALVLFLLDCLAALWLTGALKRLRLARTVGAASLVLLGLIVAGTGSGHAQEAVPTQRAAQGADADQFALRAANETRLAYVLTGSSEVDNVSFAGLSGLNQVLLQRTAVEPGVPIGIDLERDEIVFFSLLYWPVVPGAKPPSPAALAKIDAFMKNGGTVFFDTRDQEGSISSFTGAPGPGTMALRQILETLDIPPIEPVPPDHVLTKAFYLLQAFPGRWAGGQLWVEQSQRPGEVRGSNSDGVTSIIIGSNDYASAWAVGTDGQPMFPVVPSGERQREFAYRTGVNVVMYALTGNYKADQVHVPALLERLGQ